MGLELLCYNIFISYLQYLMLGNSWEQHCLCHIAAEGILVHVNLCCWLSVFCLHNFLPSTLCFKSIFKLKFSIWFIAVRISEPLLRKKCTTLSLVVTLQVHSAVSGHSKPSCEDAFTVRPRGASFWPENNDASKMKVLPAYYLSHLMWLQQSEEMLPVNKVSPASKHQKLMYSVSIIRDKKIKKQTHSNMHTFISKWYTVILIILTLTIIRNILDLLHWISVIWRYKGTIIVHMVPQILEFFWYVR